MSSNLSFLRSNYLKKMELYLELPASEATKKGPPGLRATWHPTARLSLAELTFSSIRFNVINKGGEGPVEA